jgi:hypothetical protein
MLRLSVKVKLLLRSQELTETLDPESLTTIEKVSQILKLTEEIK